MTNVVPNVVVPAGSMPVMESNLLPLVFLIFDEFPFELILSFFDVYVGNIQLAGKIRERIPEGWERIHKTIRHYPSLDLYTLT